MASTSLSFLALGNGYIPSVLFLHANAGDLVELARLINNEFLFKCFFFLFFFLTGDMMLHA